MTRWFSKRQRFALFVLVPLVMLSSHPLAAQDTVTSEPIEVTFGSGPFNLLTPAVGLSDLSSYRATLTLSFEGTSAGQSEQWSRTYTLLVTQTPPARQLTIDRSEDAAAQVYMAEINGTFYERRDGSCTASPIEAEGAFAQTWEPAGFLDSVIGAGEAGTETVNDVAANHYTFDESAQGASGIAESTGELWIAYDGGYLVRYTLVTTASADYFGEGIEGTLTWDYQLVDVNQPLEIEVPKDCPAGMLNVPVLPDATDVLNMPGSISYSTSSGLEDAVAFYEEQVAASGGQPASPPVITDTIALFGFTLDDQPILVSMSTDSGSTLVQIYSLSDPAQLAIAAEVPDERGAQAVAEPENTVDECAAGADSIPILSDATSVQATAGLLSYMTQTSLADVTAFYEEQVAALGGQVSSSVPASDFMAMLDVRQGNLSVSVIISPVGGTTSVAITSMNPTTPLSYCMVSQPAATEAGAAPDTATGCPTDADYVPMLPDAASVQRMPGTVTYTTSTSMVDAVAFYEEQLAALGQITSPMPPSDLMTMMNVQQGTQVISVTIMAMGETHMVTITFVGASPFAPPADCTESE